MDTTNSDHRQKLKLLITESVDASIEDKMWCPSSLEIQDIDFRVVRIEKKLDGIIRFLKRRVKPVLEDMSGDDHE